MRISERGTLLKLLFPDQAPTTGQPLPEYENPPVVETSVGIQFDGLDGYRSLHAAKFWDRVRGEYSRLEEFPPLEPVFETFGQSSGQAPQMQMELVQGAIQPRFFFINEGGNQLVQLQADRLFFNWRRVNRAESYPRYAHVREELNKQLNLLTAWASEEGLGRIVPTQCEAVYVNRIPLQDANGNGCGLSFFFPWLNGLKGVTESGTFNFRRRLSTENGEPIARLHCMLNYGTDEENKREAHLVLHVRGRPISPHISDCLELIDAERDVIVRTFTDITSAEAHLLWERKR